MAAKDYRICIGLHGAHIAKVNKRIPYLMTDDKRSIELNEILSLIDWFANKSLPGEYKFLNFESYERKGKVVKICYTDKLPNEEDNVQ